MTKGKKYQAVIKPELKNSSLNLSLQKFVSIINIQPIRFNGITNPETT